jgi:hypothetical protein
VSVAAGPAEGQSSNYNTTAEDACLSGWGEIKNDVYGGDLSAGIATFSGNNVCKISSGGVPKAYFVIGSSIGWKGYDGTIIPSTMKILTRPDGSRIIFENDGSTWSSISNPGATFELVGSEWVYTEVAPFVWTAKPDSISVSKPVV